MGAVGCPGRAAARIYRYRPPILERLAEHGIRPTPSTPPGRVRDLLADLYRYELRRLREQERRRGLAKPEYLQSVLALRRKYALLSVPLAQWTD